MRRLIPAGVVATGVGLFLLYVPLWKGIALIVPPQAPFALVIAGLIGLVAGAIGAWRSRSMQVGGVAAAASTDARAIDAGVSHRLADATALAGLGVALAALLAAVVSKTWHPPGQ